jgi:hypothetical protein
MVDGGRRGNWRVLYPALTLTKSRIVAALSFHEHQIACNLEAREAQPSVLFDVYYDRLIADPICTVRDIYDHYGLAWSEE